MEKVIELYIDQECDGSGCGHRLIVVTDNGDKYVSQKMFKVRSQKMFKVRAGMLTNNPISNEIREPPNTEDE